VADRVRNREDGARGPSCEMRTFGPDGSYPSAVRSRPQRVDAERGGVTAADPADIRVGFRAARHGMVGPGDRCRSIHRREEEARRWKQPTARRESGRDGEGAFDEGATRGSRSYRRSLHTEARTRKARAERDRLESEVAVLSEEVWRSCARAAGDDSGGATVHATSGSDEEMASALALSPVGDASGTGCRRRLRDSTRMETQCRKQARRTAR